MGDKFDFSFGEEDSIEGMKRLIVEEVNSFCEMVRTHAPRVKRANLPLPSRDDMINSPIHEYAPPNGATSSFTHGGGGGGRPPSPIMDDPSEDLERELAGTHLAGRKF
ncbi:hypothetical protein BD410DRAFT_841607 [Rickenella mellea]|uniref:Uncharacterized protein n=1 Tax=Rickenella mellea TaxID=50990 RepID=A0A4Y7PXA5_9AGAM|nr:hypothetical protein BD410DRAFT_841607 [Rickenella mellea]